MPQPSYSVPRSAHNRQVLPEEAGLERAVPTARNCCDVRGCEVRRSQDPEAEALLLNLWRGVLLLRNFRHGERDLNTS